MTSGMISLPSVEMVGVTTAHEVFNPGITIGLGINQMGFEVPWLVISLES